MLDIREKLKKDMIEDIKQVNEEIVIQNERIVELGLQIYSTKLYTDRKFLQNAELDVRIRSANEMLKDLGSRLDKLKSKVKKQKGWMNETDKHLKQYLPLQMSCLMFDSLFRTADTSQSQQSYRDYFAPLFDTLEQHIKKYKDPKIVPLAPDCGPDLQFEKLNYILPSSLTAPLLSDRSSIRKADVSVKDKKGGKKDKKDNISG